MITRADASLGAHPDGRSLSRTLGKLYLRRAAFSVLWVASVTSVSLPSSSTTVSVLVALILTAYPAADLVASITDLRTDPTGPATSIQRANAAVDVVAVGLVALASSFSLTATMNTFAGWAILSGAIQLIVAGHRLGRLRGQWPMIISGAGSIFAGTTIIDWTGSEWTALHTLAQYSIGGAIWYLLTAIWLLLPIAGHVANPQES